MTIPSIDKRIMDQRPSEYRAWAALCVGMGVDSYVELGCGGGGAANYMRQAGVKQVVAVDSFVSRTMENVVLESCIPLIPADSHNKETVGRVLDALGGLRPDVVFIDADHSTEAVRKDFNLWWEEAKLMVAFHDILIPTVAIVWEELCLRYSSVQIIGRDFRSACIWQDRAPADGRVLCGGIGVLFKE